MSFLKTFLAIVIATAIFSTPALARDKGKDYGKKDMKHSMMSKDYMSDMMSKVKRTMEIVRDLNHKPTDAEKRELDKMIGEIDTMMSEHKKVWEKKKKMMMDDDMDDMKEMDDGM